ncbi:MAG TPA: hypothetical protein VK907_12370 [Phnomibacter sp.]|nr:hypothetical protein [Phnomibacter sp.]
MVTKLVQIGNSFGIRISKNLIRQYHLDECAIELVAGEEGILLKPIPLIPPRSAWDDLFAKAQQKGFSPREDLEEFSDWDNTLNDGEGSF